MKQLKSPVIVERRRRKRILTLRNIGAAAAVLVLIVVAMNIRSEMRDTSDGDFGRLYQRELSKVAAVEPAAVVESNMVAVDEAASADPFSLESAAREQYLGRASLTPEPVIQPAHATWTSAGEDTGAPKAESRVKIVGGPDGVAIVEEQRRAPVLGGGFGRE